MLYALFVKPVALAALAGALWLVWRAGDRFEPAEARRHRRWVGLAAAGIILLVLGPPAWEVLSARPGEVASWLVGLAAAAAVVRGYALLLGAARRRAGRDRPDG